ncbi:MAG TPA: DUF4830 domain-containing protein [Candidatus Limnocylindria bacterium]|nr:DUF4830 domain-containing protein [Candidatus Limnocylindria bacterium]
MRLAPAVLALLAVGVSACAQPAGTGVPQSVGACLLPSDDPNAVSIAALVDRADIIVLAAVVRIETPPVPSGAARDLPLLIGDGQRLTLRATETVKGTVASEFAVYDGPCPLVAAKSGESLVLFLDDDASPDGTLRPIGLPLSALRATPDRSLAQIVSEIRATRPLDGDARTLFQRYGWNVSGKHAVDELVLPAAAEFALAGREITTMGARLVEPFERYATLSAAVGLDPRPYAGKAAELLTFFLEGKRGELAQGSVLGHVLIAERRIVGAWVSVLSESGTFALSDRAAVLALPASTPAHPIAPANRVPQGVNIARAYDLASARSIAFKTGAGGGGEISDAATIRAFAEALDETLSTVQAPLDNAQPPTRYWLHFDFATRSLSLQYDASDGMITVFLDGFSAKAPARFAALVADLR